MTAISLLAAREAKEPNFTQAEPALQVVHPSANVRPLVLHCLVPFLTLPEVRNTKRRHRIWILVLHTGPHPFDFLVHPRRSENPRPSDAWLDNGIRCMMASSAS